MCLLGSENNPIMIKVGTRARAEKKGQQQFVMSMIYITSLV
jgi:hypothetical protein